MPEDNFNKYCEGMLVQYKRRNGKAVARHLKGVCDILRHEDDHIVQTKFGGSVSKGTYVTGLSDVDVLLIVNQSSLRNKSPAKVIEYVQNAIERRLPRNSVEAGRLAVTVRYADNTEIQVLPALRTTDGFRIADPGSTKWSNVVHPDRFAERLARVNTAKGGRVVPVIKLAKAMADCFITREDTKISGYHMESLAINAFRGYQGPLDSKAMLIHFLGYAMTAVKQPITDSTGQSRYVDEYLGPVGKVNSCETGAAFNTLFCVGRR